MQVSEGRSHGASRLEASYSRIAESLAQGEVGFLFGAGMSADRGIPAGSDLAKKMLREAVLGPARTDEEHPVIDPLATSYPFEAIAHFCERELNYRSLATWLRAKAGFAAATPGDAHQHLEALRGQIGAHLFPDVVFTTNFDDLIETQFGADARTITHENIEELAEARRQRQVAVVHLHGSVSRPDTVVVGEQQQAALRGPLSDLFRAHLGTDVFVLVGYSLSETNMRSMFFHVQEAADTRFGLDKRTYVVAPATGDPSDAASEAGIAAKLWDQRNVTLLPVSASEFFRTLLAATRDFVMVTVREWVATRLKVDAGQLDEMLSSAAQDFQHLRPADFLLYLYYTLTPWGEAREE